MSPSSSSLRSDNCRRNLSMQKSWNLWKNHLFKHTLKIKRYSQFVQVLHNCNFYDSPICHKDAEDGSGQGPHVRMQLYNCPLPSIQLSCIENYAAHTGPAPDPPSHVYLMLVLLLLLQQCQDPDYPYWEFALYERSDNEDLQKYFDKITFTQESSIRKRTNCKSPTFYSELDLTMWTPVTRSLHTFSIICVIG